MAPARLVVLAAEESVEAARSPVVTALLIAKAVVETVGVAAEAATKASEASGVSAIERDSESGAEEADSVRSGGETR